SLQFHRFLEGGDINAFLFAGHLEFMWAGDMPVIKAAANTSIVVTAQIKTAFASIVARNLLSMDQLKNRRIGYAPGSSGHHALLQGLALHNMSEKDVQLVQMPINQMIASIQNSSIDAFAAWEPTPTLAMEKIKDLTVPYRVLTQSYLYFSKSFADANPDLTRLLTAANLRAIRWMSKNTNNARQACQWHVTLAEQFLGQPAAFSISQCQSILQRDLLDPLPMAMFPLENLKRGGTITQQVEFLQKIGALKANVDPEKIASAFNPAIQQEIVRHMEIWKINEFDYQ
ncbi:MAG TPA: ABC transporter substrate-binding protein, partial [Magnetococcales bacterium]|nr:ABC transporter substrate-binding protein [Magnetococcales bacterium]